MIALEVSGLEYGYSSKEKVLDGLSMSVTKGSIYAFLGANGEGKSTTIRNILGLLKPSKGDINLLGERVSLGWNSVYSRVGSMIESPSLYYHMTGEQHLNLVCKYRGLSTEKVATTLDLVGLTQARNKKVKAYSTGMKQRLGLGMAIIHDPEMVILDEPTNGLDPSGILEMRRILKQISEAGRTILLSSHILAEVEKVATHFGVLSGGKLIHEGLMDDLSSRRSEQQALRINCSDTEMANRLLEHYEVHVLSSNLIEVNVRTKDENALIVRTLVQNGIKVFEVMKQGSDLEKLFLEMTNTKE